MHEYLKKKKLREKTSKKIHTLKDVKTLRCEKRELIVELITSL